MKMYGATPYERIMANIERITESGCWIWMLYADKGYGRITIENKPKAVHRWLYQHIHGPLHPKIQLDHLCRVTYCVNPAHLEPVTSAENMMRSKHPSILRALSKTCAHGHPYTPDNSMILPNKTNGSYSRKCRICWNTYMRDFRKSHPGISKRRRERVKANAELARLSHQKRKQNREKSNA